MCYVYMGSMRTRRTPTHRLVFVCPLPGRQRRNPTRWLKKSNFILLCTCLLLRSMRLGCARWGLNVIAQARRVFISHGHKVPGSLYSLRRILFLVHSIRACAIVTLVVRHSFEKVCLSVLCLLSAVNCLLSVVSVVLGRVTEFRCCVSSSPT
jgi:hypothetical protein